MKRFNLTLTLIAVIAALSFTACGSSSEYDAIDGGSSSKGQKTLKVDDEWFYAANCSAEQTKGSGMYLNIRAVTNPDFPYNGHELAIHISPSKVAQLKEGDMFDRMSIQFFRHLNEIVYDTYLWRKVDGYVEIKRITDMEMTIQINNLVIEHKNRGTKRTISGTAVLNSGVYTSKGKLLSFADAIN